MCHACAELPGTATATSDQPSELLVAVWDGNVRIAQRRVCVVQGNGRRVNMSHVCERLVVGPESRNHHKTQPQDGCPDLVEEASGSEAPAVGGAPVAAANLTAPWPGFLEDMTLTSLWQQWHGLPAEESPRLFKLMK